MHSRISREISINVQLANRKRKSPALAARGETRGWGTRRNAPNIASGAIHHAHFLSNFALSSLSKWFIAPAREINEPARCAPARQRTCPPTICQEIYSSAARSDQPTSFFSLRSVQIRRKSTFRARYSVISKRAARRSRWTLCSAFVNNAHGSRTLEHTKPRGESSQFGKTLVSRALLLFSHDTKLPGFVYRSPATVGSASPARPNSCERLLPALAYLADRCVGCPLFRGGAFDFDFDFVCEQCNSFFVFRKVRDIPIATYLWNSALDSIALRSTFAVWQQLSDS